MTSNGENKDRSPSALKAEAKLIRQVAKEKDRIRQRVLQQRRDLSKQWIALHSKEIILRFFRSSAIHELRTKRLCVGMYRAMPDELDLSLLESHFREYGWRVHFPRIVSRETREMEFVEVPVQDQFGHHWHKGAHMFEEPVASLAPTPAPELDLIFIPGVAYSETGERLGMGLGYYDRYLVKAPRALRVALVFDFQIVPELYQEEHDQLMHWIVTEKREWKMPFLQQWWERFK